MYLQVINFLVMYSSHSPVTSSLLGPNNLLEILFSFTLCRLTRENKNSYREMNAVSSNVCANILELLNS